MKFYRDLFEASLNRVVPERDKQRFFQAFYSTFIHMSPETEQHFSQRSGEAGQQMIFKKLFRHAGGQRRPLRTRFSGTAGAGAEQGRPAPAAAFFALWREAMLKTVRASDPLCDEEILTAWAMAIAPGLEYLRRQAELHYQTAGH